MKRHRAVFFDLDGTLLDTSAGVIHTIDHIITQFDLPMLSEEEKRSFIGPPVQQSFQEHYGCTQERAWELAAAWREAYKEKFLFEAVPYDGIYDLLDVLRSKGIKTCVATNKREDYSLRLLEHFYFLPLFDCVVGSDLEGKRRKSDMIKLCMDRTEVVDPAQGFMVGDTVGDMKAAQEVGTHFIGVTYGFGFKKTDVIDGVLLVDDVQGIGRIFDE